MEWWQALIIAVAGVWAGLINAVVGSGTLVTFPTLVALGYPPVVATTSNAIGLITGAITGAIGYRAEIVGQARRLVRYGIASAIGAICGTILLLGLPHGAFETIVPALVGLAVLLVALQPMIMRRLRRLRGEDDHPPSTWHTLVLFALIFAVGIYGGYFTAAQGVMLVGVLGLLLRDPLQRLNGMKNVLVSIVNVVAGVIYAFVAPINWTVVAILAVSSIVGGLIGARIGRKLPPLALRIVIIVIGLAAIVYLLWF